MMIGKLKIQKLRLKLLKVKGRLMFLLMMIHTIGRSLGVVNESEVEEMQRRVRGRDRSSMLKVRKAKKLMKGKIRSLKSSVFQEGFELHEKGRRGYKISFVFIP